MKRLLRSCAAAFGLALAGSLAFAGIDNPSWEKLLGDATGQGAGIITTVVGKVNGVTYPASPSTHQVPVVTATNTVTYKTVPNCTDTAGQHLNYTQSTDLFSCGTSAPFSASPITNSIAGDVNLSNTGSYFIGPTVAQGSIGTWCASGTVTLQDTTATATYNVKLWDGTTVIDSTQTISVNTNSIAVTLSGCLATPAGNLRIEVNDQATTTGRIRANLSGNSKDSTITAFRVN